MVASMEKKMSKRDYSAETTDQLGDMLSDYYKDTHGFRPRHIDLRDRAAVIAALERLDWHHEQMKSTFEGREELRSQGWVIHETDPELKQKAFVFAQARDRQRDIEDQELTAAGYFGLNEKNNEADRYKI